MEIEITKAQLLKGQAFDNGWYKGIVQSASCSTKRKADSIDGEVTLSFEDPVLAADERTIDHTFFNMLGKGIGFLSPYIAAIQGKSVKEIADALEAGQKLSFDFEACQGKKIQFEIKNELYEGRITSKVKNWLPYSAEPVL